MSTRKAVVPRFLVLRKGEVIRVVPVHRARLVVGSEDGADLRLKHPAIAARHLEVNVVGGRFLEAANLAGEGRVLLGGAPMDRARLRAGDELDLGPVTLRLTFEEPAARPAEAPAPPTEDSDTDADAPSPARVDTPPPQPDPPSAPNLDVELDESVLDPSPVVIIEPPGGKTQRIPLRIGSFVVGAGRCAFRLSYPGVAPAHAEMMVMPDGLVYVKNLAGSGLVTLRNGAPVQFARWKAGDRLQVGPVSLQLHLVPRAELVAERTPAPAPVPPRPSPGLPRLAPEAAMRAPQPPTAAPAPVDPAPTRPAAPPPPQPVAARAAPVVRIAGKRPPKGAPVEQGLVRTNTVEVSLDLSAANTFEAHSREDYGDDFRPPGASLWRRLVGPALVACLLAIIGLQWWTYREKPDDRPRIAAKVASGRSGLDAAQVDAVKPGQGPVRVGNPESARRGLTSRPSAAAADDGWVPDQPDLRDREMARLAAAHADTALNDDREESSAPTSSDGREQGYVEMKDVEAVFYAERKQLAYCFQKAREDEPNLSGVFWMNLTLGEDGRIRDAQPDGRSTAHSESATNCLRKRLASFSLPKPRGGAVTFAYPFEVRD